MHLLDMIENAAKGGAARVQIDFERDGARFEMWIRDDGPGLPPSVRENPTDPFVTTRTDRKAGLGLAMLRRAAERTGGSMDVDSAPGKGVAVHAAFDLGHVDAQPVGPLDEALASAFSAWPGLDFEVRIGPERRVVVDTRAIKKEFKGIDFSTPKVHKFFSFSLHEELASIGIAAGPRLGV